MREHKFRPNKWENSRKDKRCQKHAKLLETETTMGGGEMKRRCKKIKRYEENEKRGTLTLATALGMTPEVEVTTSGDAHQLLRAEGEFEGYVRTRPGVVRQFVAGVDVVPQQFRSQSDTLQEGTGIPYPFTMK